MKIEQQYENALREIETAIVHTYREHPELSDYDVMRILEILVDRYSGETIGRPPRSCRLSELEQTLMKEVLESCEWLLGRGEPSPEDSSEDTPPAIETLSLDEIILCLKRILKSAKMWNKEGGRKGYLNYVNTFIM